TRFDSEEKFAGYVGKKCRELSEELKTRFAEENGDMKLSASIGVAMFPDNGRTFEELYAACDKALYESKKAGKNRFSFAKNESGVK
ncbi:MAG: diguanylate cyclase, partial [Ruminococcus sp.]|nr:diguanylate cyclase [Ruminococcus sp.]